MLVFGCSLSSDGDQPEGEELLSTEKTTADLTIPIDAYPHIHEDQTLQDALDIIRSFKCEDQLQFSELLVLNDEEQLVCVSRITLAILDRK